MAGRIGAVDLLLGVGVGGVEGWRLVEEGIALGWTACGSQGRGSMGEVEVKEDGGYAEFGIATTRAASRPPSPRCPRDLVDIVLAPSL